MDFEKYYQRSIIFHVMSKPPSLLLLMFASSHEAIHFVSRIVIKCLSKVPFESYFLSKHLTLKTSHSFPFSKSLHNHDKSSCQRYQLTLVGKAKSKLSL